MAEKKKRSFFSRVLFFLIVTVVSVALLLSYSALFLNPEKVWFVTLAGLVFPLLVVLEAVLLIFSIFRRSSLFSWILALLIPGFLLSGRYVQFKDKGADEGPVRIVSYNVGLFAHDGGKVASDRLSLADSVARFLVRTKPDVICLQEFFLPSKAGIDNWLKTHFPGYHAEYYILTGKAGSAGNVTLSRRQVLHKGKIDFEKSTNMALFTDIRLADSTVIRIYNCHFESYNISPDSLIHALGDEEEVESTGRKMKKSIRQRPAQVDEVVRSAAESPVRSMVLGDFNDTPMSFTYQRLRRARKDAFMEAGKGFGATYMRMRPFFRIDYMLYPKDLEAKTFSVLKAPYSDHAPLEATFSTEPNVTVK